MNKNGRKIKMFTREQDEYLSNLIVIDMSCVTLYVHSQGKKKSFTYIMRTREITESK